MLRCLLVRTFWRGSQGLHPRRRSAIVQCFKRPERRQPEIGWDAIGHGEEKEEEIVEDDGVDRSLGFARWASKRVRR